ncbi:prepilin-type N-terminal cleavage/methylation domain-containing protein [Acetobacterium wieringae]|uniref:prepilin-type N-terminal cleavage/methylation domain-containing protein n=1 Tax=Acetobacterium wieringae TaxID=52694 RepID=UPI00203484F5|nr:prepilin-type N-terminal cleavage/methylation domain-containing protein [Acetobacterium wieringae]URN85271.1 prepilin-type N-terminal cleavage/methylation domain-containing protein [Acetobacterium wieringae]
MNNREYENDRGFSLIEVLTALMVISLVLGMLLSGLIYINTISNQTKINQELYYNERYIALYFQKQVLKSEKIYYKNNRIYLQDLESPDLYYNYYLYSNGFLRRYKVFKNGLTPIGSGGNSQFLNHLQSFSLSLGSNQEIIIRYSLAIEGAVYYRETVISHGRVVEFV